MAAAPMAPILLSTIEGNGEGRLMVSCPFTRIRSSILTNKQINSWSKMAVFELSRRQAQKPQVQDDVVAVVEDDDDDESALVRQQITIQFIKHSLEKM